MSGAPCWHLYRHVSSVAALLQYGEILPAVSVPIACYGSGSAPDVCRLRARGAEKTFVDGETPCANMSLCAKCVVPRVVLMFNDSAVLLHGSTSLPAIYSSTFPGVPAVLDNEYSTIALWMAEAPGVVFQKPFTFAHSVFLTRSAARRMKVVNCAVLEPSQVVLAQKSTQLL